MSNILNTAYAVTVDTLATENGVTIENGVLHVYNDKLKVHLHNEIHEIITSDTSIVVPKYGSFYSTQTQVPALETIYAITLNNTDADATSGVSIVDNSKITVDATGVYNIQFSAQLYRSTGGTSKQAIIWLRKNGVDIPATSTHVTMQANATYLVASWNFFVKLNAGQNIELMIWQDDAIQLLYDQANVTVPYPATPSVIVTVEKVN